MSRETTSPPFPDTWRGTDDALCLVISSVTVRKHGAAGAVLLAAIEGRMDSPGYWTAAATPSRRTSPAWSRRAPRPRWPRWPRPGS